MIKQLVLCLALALASFPVSAQWPDPYVPVVAPDTNSLTLYGEVSPESAAKLIAGIQTANEDKTDNPVYLYINSPGGDVLSGGMIVDAMAVSRRPIYTVVVGMAASMAAYIHTYGAKRFMAPHSVLMFHRASVGIEDDMSHIAERMALYTRVIGDYEQHLSKMTGLSLAEIQGHENTQWWLLPSDALRNHLIDGVLNPSKYPTHS